MPNQNFTSNKPYLFRAILDWLLDNDAVPYILVDANIAFVEVPREFIKDGQIVLNVNPSAIQNWHVAQEGISFSARFSGSARQIYVPMNALMAVYSQENGQGMAFPSQENEPAPAPATKSNNEQTESTSPVKADSLTSIDFNKEPEKKLINKDIQSNKKKASHLKVIK